MKERKKEKERRVAAAAAAARWFDAVQHTDPFHNMQSFLHSGQARAILG